MDDIEAVHGLWSSSAWTTVPDRNDPLPWRDLAVTAQFTRGDR